MLLPLLGLLAGVALFAEASIDIQGFYLPPQGEVNAFFNLSQYLAKVDNDPSQSPDQRFGQLLDIASSHDILQSYLVEAFLRSTKNQKFVDYSIDYLTRANIQNAPLLQSVTFSQGTKDAEHGRLTLPSGKSAESIDLFHNSEIKLFDGRLHCTVFSNNQWNVASIDDKKNPQRKMLAYNCGGGTNAFLMIFQEHKMSQAEFESSVIAKPFDREKYPNWRVEKLPIEGFLSHSNADIINFGVGAKVGPFDIKEGTSTLFLYSAKYGEGFEITWMMNFSVINAL